METVILELGLLLIIIGIQVVKNDYKESRIASNILMTMQVICAVIAAIIIIVDFNSLLKVR